ncbi:uncharacterized protein [Haliotis cracherodii]|uniref:uncharacterized protein isoform X2 n=1 Tax=Haliotis cracherodii TaxID=6455 RepID=UPI0039EC846D
MAQDSLEDGSSVMGEFDEIGSRDLEEEFGMAEQNDGEIYIQNEMVPPGGDIEEETGPPGGDIEDETGPPDGDIEDETGPPGGDIEEETGPPGGDIEEETGPPGGDIEEETGPPGGDIEEETGPPGGDIEDEAGPPGGDIEDEAGPPGGDIEDETGPPGGDIEAEVAPPGEEENQGRHTRRPPASDGHSDTAIPLAEEGTLLNSGSRLCEEPISSIYMRSIVEQAGINVSENLTISTSEGEREAQDAQDTPDEDAEQQLHQQPLNLLSQISGEISLHERTDYNQYHNMRLIMESNFGQSGPVSHTLPAVDSYLSESIFNMQQIVAIWDMPHIYQRDQLLSSFQENSLYRPNIVQRGGFLVLLHTLNSINGVDTDNAHALRDHAEGVLLNNQSLLFPVNGHFRLGMEYISVNHYNLTTLRCRLPNSHSDFIRKTYYINEWCGEQMIVPYLCGNCVVQPLGLTWGHGMVHVFLPVIEEHTRADLYSAGCTMISALNEQFPFFDINGIQRTFQNYLFRIGQGDYPPATALRNIPGLGNFLLEILKAMIRSDAAEQRTAGEILRSFRGREPSWSDSYFQTSPTEPHAIGRLRAQFTQQPNLNIPSEEILSSACEVSEVTEEQETTAVRKYDHGNSQTDSGQFTSTSNEFCTVVVKEDGVEVVTLSLPWNALTSRVYSQLSEQINISGKYVLLYDGRIVMFDTLLLDLPQIHPSMPVHLRLRRDDRVEEHGPDDSGSRSNQRSGSRTVVEGAAYNGDDHVVYDDPVQACDLPPVAGESDNQCDASDCGLAPEGDRTQRRVPSTLALTGATDGSKTLFVGEADSQRRNRSRGTCTFEDATNDEDDKDGTAATAISEGYRLDEEDDEGDKLQEEAEEGREKVSPGDNSDEVDEEESPSTDEANDVEQENEACDEDAEGRANSRPTNMERLMSSEEQEDTLCDGAGGSEKDGEDVGRNSEDDESVCGDSQTSSDENFSEDEEADDEKGGYVAGHPSRNQREISVEPEGSDFDQDVNVENNDDSELNVNGSVSHGSDEDEESDSGLTGDAPDSSSFSEVGVTVTNEASTPMSEESGSLEDED